MDIRQLRIFSESSRTLNFTRTANILGCSQANVTMQIQQLEKELGVQLFERLGKQLSLTHSGSKLLGYAERAIACIDEAKAAVQDSTRTLVIGAAESLCVYRLPETLKKYRALYPEVQITIKLLICDEYVSSLESNSVDILFSLGFKLDAPNCRIVGTRKEPVMVCARPDHPLAQKKSVGAKDFAKWPVLLTGVECCYRNAFLRHLESDYVYPTLAMETYSIQALKQAAIQGIGICVLPEMAVSEEIERKILFPLPVKGINWNIVSQVVYHKDKWRSPAIQGLLDCI